jgi:hypothetical protein
MAQRKLTYRERRVLRYHGMPAREVSVALHMSVNEVLEVRAGLRTRGHVPVSSAVEQAPEQLMIDCEIGWTTETDPEGW